ncbi:hypothetical protein BDN72DRAFT_905003 [Pluteus cervinus]|uniref:Uncharacterized protein n=1 Tax=Pluteus cervinus TaxID=181527 RepID=A0ACD3A3F2_9AGAR|nr:hypothetical protein BDN72DRAFT_905003 [Pluteus cervinus]
MSSPGIYQYINFAPGSSPAHHTDNTWTPHGSESGEAPYDHAISPRDEFLESDDVQTQLDAGRVPGAAVVLNAMLTNLSPEAAAQNAAAAAAAAGGVSTRSSTVEPEGGEGAVSPAGTVGPSRAGSVAPSRAGSVHPEASPSLATDTAVADVPEELVLFTRLIPLLGETRESTILATRYLRKVSLEVVEAYLERERYAPPFRVNGRGLLRVLWPGAVVDGIYNAATCEIANAKFSSDWGTVDRFNKILIACYLSADVFHPSGKSGLSCVTSSMLCHRPFAALPASQPIMYDPQTTSVFLASPSSPSSYPTSSLTMPQDLQFYCNRWAIQIAALSFLQRSKEDGAGLALRYTCKALLEEVHEYLRSMNTPYAMRYLEAIIPAEIASGIHNAAAAESYFAEQEALLQSLKNFSISV